MAIDYGDARTGVAISDASGLLTGTTTVIHSRSADQVLDQLAQLIQTHGVDRLVMGFPRNMDGTEGPRADLYRDFAARLEARTGMAVALWDERRTTIEAHQILHQSGKRMKDHRRTVDAVAASLILEGYLTKLRREV
jgi:putative Holliday junction resolvase